MSFWRCTKHDTLQHVKEECPVCVQPTWFAMLTRARELKAQHENGTIEMDSLSYAQGVIDMYYALPEAKP